LTGARVAGFVDEDVEREGGEVVGDGVDGAFVRVDDLQVAVAVVADFMRSLITDSFQDIGDHGFPVRCLARRATFPVGKLHQIFRKLCVQDRRITSRCLGRMKSPPR
jgi:hypothetical protein